jgi:hypothetical protein
MKQTKANEKFLLNRLKGMYGENFDPIMKMAENAKKLQEIAEREEASSNDFIDANKEWERIAQFTSPKLKSMEIKGDGEAIQLHVHRGGDKKNGG